MDMSIECNQSVSDGVIKFWHDSNTSYCNVTRPKINKTFTMASRSDLKTRITMLNLTLFTSLISIPDYAFSSMSSLRKLILPPSIEKIGDNAFQDCYGLVGNIDMKNVKYIGQCAFYNSLYSCHLHFQNNVTFAFRAFYGSRISSISFNDNCYITGLNECAFMGCSSLSCVIDLGGLTRIPDSAFYKTNITGLRGLDNITYISTHAFSLCYYLGGILNFPKLTNLRESAFSFCGEITEVHFTSTGLHKISKDAFLACFKLKKVVFPPNLNYICDYAFFDCAVLESFTLVDSVSQIGKSAFYKTNLPCGYLAKYHKKDLYKSAVPEKCLIPCQIKQSVDYRKSSGRKVIGYGVLFLF